MTSEVTRRTGEEGANTFVTPADRLISNLDGVYYKLTEAAEILHRSPTTLRRLMKRPEFKNGAPSYKVQQGLMWVYLYTPDDIQQLRDYFAAQTPEKRTDGTEGHSEE